MSGFYNYDTRGASYASQIVSLERMVSERDAEIERLRAQPAPLTDEEIILLWAGPVQRPILGKNKIFAFARAIEKRVREGR